MKKWKIVLISLVVILLCGAGAAYYFINIKEYDVADEEVNELTDTEYKVEIPTLEEIESNEETVDEDEKGNGASTSSTESSFESANSNDDNSTGTQQKTTTNSSKTSEKTPTGTVSVESIKKRYEYAFAQLEDQATGRVDALIGRAYSEYSGKKGNGEEISFSYFYVKYSNAGKSLEAKTDEAFNAVYSQLQKELKASGYSVEHAEEYRQAYNKAKEARRSAIMKKAMAVL
ncbi:hypothetical protein RRV45_20330 [Bacillus sp. DTU_2020_1000418_1_SI_GHA_SEK_038]|uniref:hypothetical protein n=1 Tax=Bacillus sp. DTU_2020_1000418_1_SI_GHA_SEK_038 TaxID=3077585 RepID=UPI0028EDEE07|nr:hypothetical protein [Bacillus sp. DTU_2020_1000418_1_SI_GHA_SEK_038]WNS75193.1 hypothetical protein RRV45_20330 [Bacillus sp. DTU_2020_1000418_1_SI_GHA_SEK_038]